MKPNLSLRELKAALAAAPAADVRILLPDGDAVPAHYHITEVGRVQKDFVDCGGRWRASQTCVLQVWLGTKRDDGHRLAGGKFLKILALAARLFPDESLPIEVEYEAGIVAQFPVVSAGLEDGDLVLRLGEKHTDCLARQRDTVDAAIAGCDCGCGGSEAIAAGKSCC